MPQTVTSPTMKEKHPEVFAEDQDANPRQHKRVIPMEVLSLGMSRTGTATMRHALNILDFPCYHGIDLIANIRDTKAWNKALDAKFFGQGDKLTCDEWDKLLGNYSAITDLPAILFAEELLHCYPQSKVVLVERDIEKWYKSFNEGIISSIWHPAIRAIARLDSRFVGKLASTSERWTTGWMEAHSKSEMQVNARPKYKDHYKMVRRVTPSSRLLEFKLEDGWEPLCTFLGRPIPDIDFPRVNEAAALSEKIRLIAWKGIKNVLRTSLKVSSVILVLVIAWWAVGVSVPRRVH